MGVYKLTQQDFDRFIAVHRPVVVKFEANWCGPCRALSPKLEQLSHDYAEKVLFGKVDIDRDHALAQKHNVRSVPTLILFVDGKERLRGTGNLSVQAMRTPIDKILAELG